MHILSRNALYTVCNCIELPGMKVYICIYVSSNHGISDAVQVLQMYKIASA